VTSTVIIFLVIGASTAGFVNGLAGTGTALFALGFFLIVLPPSTAVAIVCVLAIVPGVQGLWVVRSDIIAHKSKLMLFLLPGLAGVPVGVMLLDHIDSQTLRIGVGLLLVIYGGYFSFRAALPAIHQATPKRDVAIGLVGGLLGGLASLSGAIPAMWLSMRPWSKGTIRAVLQSFNMVILTATALMLLFKGAYDATAIKALLVTIPITLVASQVGIFVFKRLSDTHFRRLLIGLSLLMGAGILLNSF